MPEQEQDILWGVCDLQMLNIPQYVTHICWGQQECGLSWVSWPILQKEDTGYHAWKCSSFLPGPRKKVLNAAVKNCRDSDVLQWQWQRARRKSIALDKSPKRSHIHGHTSSYFTSNSRKLPRKWIPPPLCHHQLLQRAGIESVRHNLMPTMNHHQSERIQLVFLFFPFAWNIQFLFTDNPWHSVGVKRYHTFENISESNYN